MPSILLAETPLDTRQLLRNARAPDGLIHGLEPGCPTTLRPCTPYALCEALDATDRAILSDLSQPTVAQTLTNLSGAYGGETTLALAEVLEGVLPTESWTSNYASATIGLTSARLDMLFGAIQTSQRAILDYHQATRPGSGSGSGSGSGRAAARQALIRANENLNHLFRHEMGVARRHLPPRYRKLSSNEQRLADLVRHTRKASRLDVASLVESGQLGRVARRAKYFGKGFMALDFGSRVHDVQAEYESGGDWRRKAFIESTSFAVTALVGAGATSVGADVLLLLVAATPAGWALIVGGLATAAAIASISSGTDSLAHSGFSWAYDQTATWMRGRP